MSKCRTTALSRNHGRVCHLRLLPTALLSALEDPKRLNAQRFNVTIHVSFLPVSRGALQLHTEAAGAAPPDAFGPFRVLHQIGAGALGPVFRAYEPDRDRLVAVKLFRLDIPPERVHQLAAELDKLIEADLRHPVIASAIAAGIAGVSAYLGQDFVAADSLDIVFRERGLAASPHVVGDAINLATQLAEALDAAADAGIVHGAMHPRDILVSSDETRLTGLGIARALERTGIPSHLRRPYTAPERAAGKSWDRRADVFSLAVVIHEMIWGRRLTGVGEHAAQSLTPVNGADSAALRRAFARALAEEPQQRFDTALAFVEALREACPAARPRRPAVVRSQPPAPPSLHAPRLPLDELVLAHPPSMASEEDPVELVGSAAGDLDLQVAGASPEVRTSGIEPDLVPVNTLPDDADLEPGIVQRVVIVDEELSDLEPAASAFASEGPEDGRDAYLEDTHVIAAAPERDTSTSVRPLALALFLGVAMGFAGGYALGYRAQPGSVVAAIGALPTAASATAQASTAVERPVGAREFTETAIAKDLPLPRATPVSSTLDGRLVVRSTPAGARVFVDGREAGKTPTTTRSLASGGHDVRIVRDGYAAVERRVVVTPAKPSISLSVTLTRVRATPPAPAPVASTTTARGPGSLGVDSRPSGARVFVDGKLVGTTPLVLERVQVGDHAVHLERDGYQRWSSSVRVVAGERNRIAASLER